MLIEAGALPLAFYGDFLLERRYGLSNQRLGGWLLDQGKSFGLELVFACAGAAILYALIRIRRMPGGCRPAPSSPSSSSAWRSSRRCCCCRCLPP